MTTASAVFLGTPEAAVPALEALTGATAVRAVVTRPDRPRGRSRRPRPSAVKEAAERLGLDVVQPGGKDDLAQLPARVGPVDVGVVVAFGMILPPALLDWPRRGFLNVHFSLLPRWRGAAPVERAMMAGETELGVSLMVMDEGLDTGPVLASARLDTARLNGGEATAALSRLGAELLSERLEGWLAGEAVPVAQDSKEATYAPRLEPDDRLLDPAMTVQEVVNRVRALAPDRAAQVLVDGDPHQLHAVWGITGPPARREPGEWHVADGVPRWTVADGEVLVLKIQPPGKRPMSGEDWWRGRRV